MSEQTPTVPLEYRFETIEPFGSDDRWFCVATGGVIGLMGGVATDFKVLDAPAERHTATINRLTYDSETYLNPAPYQRQLRAVEAQRVPHLPAWLGAEVIVGEMGAAIVAVSSLLLWSRRIGHALKMRRRDKIVENARYWLDLDEQIRQ